MKRYLFTFLLITGCVSPNTHIQDQARKHLIEESKCADYLGSIYTQARVHDGIDYRTILIEAINFNENALGKLFEMNFMGEGGETHCSNLLHLMILWGDEKFSKALSKNPQEIQSTVVSMIDYAWSDPEWHNYPKTLALSPSNITIRNTVNTSTRQ